MQFTFRTSAVQSILIWGCDGNDHLQVNSNVSLPATIDGRCGDDRVTVGHGRNTISTDGGNDVIIAGNGNNTIDSGAGNDVAGGVGTQTVFDDDAQDRLTGGQGNDWFIANTITDNSQIMDIITDLGSGEVASDIDLD